MARRGEGARRERRQDCATAHRGAAGDARLLQKAQSGVARHSIRGFTDRAVNVDLVKIDLVVHVAPMWGWQLDRASVAALIFVLCEYGGEVNADHCGHR